MAKYTANLQGDFNVLLSLLHEGIQSGNVSASYEDGSDYTRDGVRCAVRVYERYSMIGQNRVSMSITLLGYGNELYVTAITSGGSQAVLFKINRFGEDAFLQRAVDIVERYRNP